MLLENELAVVKTTAGDIRFKIGDGIHNFNDLDYTDNFLVEDIATLQNNLNLKANINSPAFTGIPTAPTADKTTSNT